MKDWNTYDEIAERNDREWSSRFVPVARRIWQRVPPTAGEKLLDVGTGTGIVVRARLETVGTGGFSVGCDCSRGHAARGAQFASANMAA